MTEHRPLFSIVMPTRNRAHLLRHALASALAQTFDDFEIVISNNASTDGTADVANSTGDGRVRYVQTDRVLPMPAHWEFALGHARGEYVTYLCDDDAMVPGLLSRLHECYQRGSSPVIYWNAAVYFHPSWCEPHRRHHLFVRPATGRAIAEPSVAILDDLFALRYDDRPVPRMLNACCPRDMLGDLQQRAGRFFVESCPDYSAAALLAAAADEVLFLDFPLMLSGCGSESIGGSTLRRMNNATTNTFWSEYRNGHEIDWQAPLRQGSVPNAIADSLLRCRLLLGGPLAEYDLDWTRYFLLCWQQIEQERRFGGETAAYVAEWETALAAQPREIRTAVRQQQRSRWMARTRDLGSRAKRRLSTVLGRNDRGRIIHGKAAGFHNIFECAAFVERQFCTSDPLSIPPVQNNRRACVGSG